MTTATMEYTGWRAGVLKWDSKIPLITLGVMLGVGLFTLGENIGWHAPHYLHEKWVHWSANDLGMWFFFAFLGLEIKIKDLIAAGRFAGSATIGGVLIPPLCAYLLTGNWYIAIGAMATDVAFSLGAANLIQKGQAAIMALLVTALLILAVGDDLGGVGTAAAVYADNISQGYLWMELVVIVIAYFCGERGVIGLKIRQNGGAWTRYEIDVEINSTLFWVLLALFNTGVLAMAGLHWVLGGCLVLIMAPENVKHTLEHVLKPFIPLILFYFGVVNGAIDVSDGQNWGWITAACFLGGMIGKRIGIFSFGMIGRMWARKNGDHYGKIPTAQVYALALFASVNGTVAIFFVVQGLNKGYISDVDGAQAILGYFLTVPAVYAETWVLGKLGILKDDPNFQPLEEETEHGEEVMTGAAIA